MGKRLVVLWILIFAWCLPILCATPPNPCNRSGCWSAYGEALFLCPLGIPFDYDRFNGDPQREITVAPDPHWGWRLGGWFHTPSWFAGGSYQRIQGTDSRDDFPEAIGILYTTYQAVDTKLGIYQAPSCRGNFYGFLQARWIDAHQSKRSLRNNLDDRMIYNLQGAGPGIGAGAMIRLPWGFSIVGEASVVALVGTQRTCVIQTGSYHLAYPAPVTVIPEGMLTLEVTWLSQQMACCSIQLNLGFELDYFLDAFEAPLHPTSGAFSVRLPSNLGFSGLHFGAQLNF